MDAMLEALDRYMQDCGSAYYKREMIEDEMEQIKKSVIKKIELIVHPTFSLHVALALALAYWNDCPEAHAIFDELEITEKDLYALQGNIERYTAYHQKDYSQEEPEDGYSF